MSIPKFEKLGKDVVDEPLEGFILLDDVEALAESMGVKIIEEPEKHLRPESTYAIANRGVVRVPPRPDVEDDDTRAYVLLHELGHVRMGHGYGRETAEGAILEELEAHNWAFTIKAGKPIWDWVVDLLASIAQDVGLTEFGLTEKEAWHAARRAAERFGIHKSLIREAGKIYWKQVG